MRCKNCGTENPDGSRFCATCGKPLEQEEPAKNVAEQKDEEAVQNTEETVKSTDDFSDVHLALEEAGIPMVSAEVTMIPQTYVVLTNEEDIKNIQKTLDLLEDDDDVQEVYHNWEEE